MKKENNRRGAGILCHVSSLPNAYGIGSLGKEAYEFVDFLAKSKVSYWQILPLVQTGYGDSPYQSVCCHSGNPYFIDLEALRDEGLLMQDELEEAVVPKQNRDRVDYGTLYQTRYKLLKKAYQRFDIKNEEFCAFIATGEFEDYALFMSLKSRYGCSFVQFPDPYKYKENLAMFEFRNTVYKTEFCFWQFIQFVFRKQWKKLKSYANKKGIRLIGDVPLYAAYDSADVWGRPELFYLDEDLKPVEVAGCPPDYFSKTGQLWGNPLYRWNAIEAENFAWWVNRVRAASQLYDVIRIDHFRGLDRYYAIPAEAPTAETGVWEKGPAMKLFNAITKALPNVDIIAEDLGVLDDGVIALRDESGYPGMKILLFAFNGDPKNEYLPVNTQPNSVTYTGTHDNDTTVGYLKTLTEEQFSAFRSQLRTALKSENVNFPIVSLQDTAQGLVVCALANRSNLSVIPVQDLMLLDNSARMNMPSSAEGNWQFRLTEMPTRKQSAWLRQWIKQTKRV